MSTTETQAGEYIDRIGRPFLARRIAQLHDVLAEQGQAVLEDSGIDLDARLGSVFHLIATRPRLSVAELAGELGLSHQLATYRIKKLVDDGLIKQKRDPEDRTRSLLEPTAKAAPVVKDLQNVMSLLDRVYADLFEELGIDLLDITIRARAALNQNSLLQRSQHAQP